MPGCGMSVWLKCRTQVVQDKARGANHDLFPITPIYTDLRAPHERQDKPLHQRCRHSFCRSSQNQRRNKRWEEHLFKQPSKAVFHLFSRFFCSRLGLRSKPPTAAPPKPRSTDSSGSFHRGDLWYLIAGKWTRGRGSLEGGGPSVLFSTNLIKEKNWKGGNWARVEVQTGWARRTATIPRWPSRPAYGWFDNLHTVYEGFRKHLTAYWRPVSNLGLEIITADHTGEVEQASEWNQKPWAFWQYHKNFTSLAFLSNITPTRLHFLDANGVIPAVLWPWNTDSRSVEATRVEVAVIYERERLLWHRLLSQTEPITDTTSICLVQSRNSFHVSHARLFI